MNPNSVIIQNMETSFIKIKNMVEDGFAAKRIASKLNLDINEVTKIIKNENFSIKKEIFNENKISHIINLYKNGASAKNLGIKYSIDKRRIQKWAKKNNVLRNRNDSHRFTFFNENYFDKIDTPSKAYWLGFLYADAYNCEKINTVSISLSIKDLSHLKKIASAVELPENKIIKYNSSNNGKQYPSCSIKLYSKHLCAILKKHGCPQAKSFIIKYPSWLPPELDNHFIRGIFDGDGCLTKRASNNEWKWSIASTKEICDSINKVFIQRLNFNMTTSHISKTNHNTYEMYTNGNKKIHKLMKWVYDNSTVDIRLDRKFNKYEELVNQQNNRRFYREKYKVSNNDKKLIMKNHNNGLNYVDIAEKFNVHPRTVSKIVSQKEKSNPNLKPRKKIWNGPIDFPKTNNISNDVNNLFLNDLLIWNGNKLSNKYLRTIDEDKRDEIAKDIFNFYLDYDFNKIKIPKKSIESAIKSLNKYVPNIEVIDGVTYLNNSGTSGSNVYKNYFPNIIKVKNDRPSIYEVVTNKEKLWATIRNRIGNTLLYNDDRNGIPVQYPMNQSLSQLFIGAKNSGLAAMGSIFKPTVAKAIYSKWVKDGYNVLDYSCGFGTRLLGLMSCDFNNVKYFGYEPNTETYDGLIKMIDELGANAEIKKCGSEEELFNEKMDFVFSSPPYFTQERYSDEETQCYNKFPEYEDWLEKYWRTTVQNISKMLNNDGTFAINIGNSSNKFMQKLEKDLNKVIISEGYRLIDTWYMKTSKSHLSRKKDDSKKIKLEGIFFYKYQGINNGTK